MRIFTTQLITESNTFSPLPTGRRDYEQMGIHHGTASRDDPEGVFAILALWRRMAEAGGHELIEGLAAQAQPGGRTLRAVYEAFRDDILADIAANLPFDVVLVNLHGAMSADGYDDCEGDLLGRIRALVGPDAAIGAELDLHCHLTTTMLDAADVLIAYKHYPHTDIAERAKEVFSLAVATAQGEITPVTSVADCHMVGLWHTTREPMAGIVRRMSELEDGERILSVSFGHGFPWGDVDEAGARVWVISNGRQDLGDANAVAIAEALFDCRRKTAQPLVSIDDALDQASEMGAGSGAGTIVAADGADNPGGGAPSDSSYFLKRILERRIEGALIAFFYDPEVVRVLTDVGVGASLDVRIGGKTGTASGDPVDLRVEVKAILHDHHQSGLGLRWPLGTTAWVRGPDGLDLILTSVRSQPFDPESLRALGIDLASKRLIVLKSIQHFQAGFAPLASAGILYVAAPGALTPDFANIPYRTKSLDYWPKREDVRPRLLPRTPRRI